jgi:GTP-binding protein EngB required for normal cell division
MIGDIPVLAIMGHPNAGKSSVVATLTENDRIEIDKRAGTTTRSDVYPVVIDGQTILKFIDTPGFQNPTHILEWFQAHHDEMDLAGAFVAAHRDDRLFSHDRALLEPISQGAGIVLVVDGSKRIKEKDRREMELLRLTGRPRMAILNNLTTQQKHMPAWQDALSRTFNSVREFNAHRATYAERIKLLQSLKVIDQRWEPQLEATIQAFERDWERRIDQTVTTILGLLKDALALKITRVLRVDEVGGDTSRELIRKRMSEAFQDDLRRMEATAQEQIRAHFHHNVWNLPPESLLQKDLFSDDVQQLLGLSKQQLILAGAAGGAATGGVIDLGVGGLSFGTGALIGAVAGGALGAFGKAALAKVDIKKKLGIERFSMGPVTNSRFPFILMDRIILYCVQAMNWSHGRQAADETAPDRVPDKPLKKRGFTEGLSADDNRALARFFFAARRGWESSQEPRCRQILTRILRDLSEGAIDDRLDL